MNSADYQANTPYARFGDVAINATPDARALFIRRTYVHLMFAVYAFVGLECLYFALGLGEPALRILGSSRFVWLGVLGAFFVVSTIADRWARSDTSRSMQYAGLSLYVLGESVLFLPLLALARMQTVQIQNFGDVGVIPVAAVTTLAIFGGLTAYTFITRQDFSFMGRFLGLFAVGVGALIVVSIIFGFSLGIWFTWMMVVAASAYILYYTSNVLHTYRTDQYVAASLTLFASVALLFWYVIQLFMRRD
jgi:hypothetical protein